MRFPVLRHRALRVAGAAMSLFALSAPAGAFTVSDLPQAPAARQPIVALYQGSVDQPKLEQVYWRGGGWRGGGWRGGGWGRRGWGWGGGAFVGGLAAGALVGGALAGPYYGGYYGGPYGYYGYGGGPYGPGCWRSVATYYGWRRVWVC